MKYNFNNKNKKKTIKRSYSTSKYRRSLSKTSTNKTRRRKWSDKYKKSINCSRPKGFSQRQHCKYGRK